MNKHSPGPWRSGRRDMVSYAGGNDDRPWKNVYRPERDSDRWHMGQRLPMEAARAFGDTEEEALDNAALIAVAPEMLDLLREVAAEVLPHEYGDLAEKAQVILDRIDKAE